jgi:hypothetical protein
MGSYATVSFVTDYGFLLDAPSDGSEYVRKNAAWAIATGGGISDAPADSQLYARINNTWNSFTIPTLSVTNIALTGDFTGYSVGSGYYSFKYDSTANTLRMQDAVGSGVTVSATGITFPDSSTLTTASAGIPEAPIDGNYYIRINGAWHQCSIANVYDNNTMSNQNVLRI